MKTTSLDLDGLDLLAGDYFCWVSNFFDADRDITTNGIYNDGVSYNRSKTKERKFLLNGYIKNRSGINTLRGKLFTDGLKKLTVGIKGMSTVFIMCDLLNFAEDNRIPGKISCQMIAPEPFLYDTNVGTISLGAYCDNGLTFPMTFPIVLGEISGEQGVLTNAGNTTAYPVITIIGTCSNISITNSTTGQSLSFDIVLGDTDTLVIDSRPDTRGVLLNDENRIDLKVGNWISCAPGDNAFLFQRSSFQTTKHCTIALQGRWS